MILRDPIPRRPGRRAALAAGLLAALALPAWTLGQQPEPPPKPADARAPPKPDAPKPEAAARARASPKPAPPTAARPSPKLARSALGPDDRGDPGRLREAAEESRAT